jgi:hypothetical protein
MYAVGDVLALALDSGLAGIALGTCSLSRRERCGMALAFGLCDAVASLLAPALSLHAPGPSMLGIYLLCALVLAYAARRNRALLLALPALLSLDNLFSPTAATTALACGAGSAAFALLGLILASTIRIRFIRPRSRKIAGVFALSRESA